MKKERRQKSAVVLGTSPAKIKFKAKSFFVRPEFEYLLLSGMYHADLGRYRVLISK